MRFRQTSPFQPGLRRVSDCKPHGRSPGALAGATVPGESTLAVRALLNDN
jgi:hypothetical protein